MGPVCAGRVRPALRPLILPFVPPGSDAASLAARLRSTTRTWALSKEAASDPRPDPDWPDQQAPGNTTPPTPPPPMAGRLPLSVRRSSSLHSSRLCQKPEAAFCQVEPGSGVRVAGGGRAGPVRGPRSPLAQRRPDAAVGDAAGSGAGRMVAEPPSP